ncbi:uncharacterized protein LOC123525300 [Mercenaria mercenaria]|uniref:uncharacterized protein LOC123525300 n=1 Tax=Mercenaria mercenaria TaxID=6596 RepID=UPI00234F51B4|nr:uncharacterized protein LOC123525300 [Mercenaria mercenaria]
MPILYVIYFVIISHFLNVYIYTRAQHIAHNAIQDKASVINISYNKCSATKMCVHGICNEKLGTCVCYYGWRGDVCDRLVRNNHLFRPRKITRNEPYKTRHNVVTTRHRRLMNPDRYVIDLLMAFFPKLKGYFQRILELGAVSKQTINTFYISPVATSKFAMEVKAKTHARKRTTTTELPEIDTASAISEIKSTSEEVIEELESGVCSDSYKISPLSERMCTPGLVCKYGTCSSEHKGTYIAFDCSCDKGASGLLCEHKCCLDCGNNGRCDIFADGKPYCRCRRGYSGDNCERSESEIKLVNPHLSSTNIQVMRFLPAGGAAIGIALIIFLGIMIWKHLRSRPFTPSSES